MELKQSNPWETQIEKWIPIFIGMTPLGFHSKGGDYITAFCFKPC